MKKQITPAIRFIVPDIKAYNFIAYSSSFVDVLSLSAEKKTKLRHRINNCAFELTKILNPYVFSKSKQSARFYLDLTVGLASIRKSIKISYAVNPLNKKLFIDFWKHLCHTLVADSKILGDTELQRHFEDFEKTIHSI